MYSTITQKSQSHNWSEIHEYKESQDIVGFKIIFGSCLLLAFLFNPGDKRSYASFQMLIAFTIYLETFALIPQMKHLRDGNDSAGLTTHYIL